MKYDLEIVIPVSTKYKDRIRDLEKYGIFNIKNRKVLVTLLASGGEKIDVGKKWGDIDINFICNENKNYASNLYAYFLNMTSQSRWIMKIDDDTCTDIDGLIEVLDKFYGHTERYYLGCNLSRFQASSPEAYLGDFYEKFFGKKFIRMNHEMECCVMSEVTLEEIKSNESSVRFLKERCEFPEGATDVALAYAAALCKIYPIDFPFGTYLPLINEFSVFGGDIYHIHMISGEESGENFQDWDRCGPVQHKALLRAISKEMNEIEKSICDKKFILETEEELLLFSFYPDRRLKIKFDNKNYIWVEDEGFVKIFFDKKRIEMTLRMDDSGCLVGKNEQEEMIKLKPF